MGFMDFGLKEQKKNFFLYFQMDCILSIKREENILYHFFELKKFLKNKKKYTKNRGYLRKAKFYSFVFFSILTKIDIFNLNKIPKKIFSAFKINQTIFIYFYFKLIPN